MFNKKSKTGQDDTNRATITVQAVSLSDEQRQKIETSLSNLDPSWEGDRFQLSVPMDSDTQKQLSQLVSMFPNGDVRLETTSGNIIMSGGSQEYGSSYSRGTGSPYSSSHTDDDTEPLPHSSRK